MCVCVNLNRTYQNTLCRATDDDGWRCPFMRQSVWKCVASSHCWLNYTANHLYVIPSTDHGIYCKVTNMNIHLFFPSCFRFIILDAYYILCYITSFFFIYSVLCIPNSPILGDCLVCLVVKLAVVSDNSLTLRGLIQQSSLLP